MFRIRTAVALCCYLAVLSGCKIIATADKHKAISANSAQAFDKGFDGKAAELWPSKVLPYAQGKAGKLQDVQAAIAANADQAGTKYGYREKGDSNPWTMIAQIDGKIVAANTESRAATIDVDVDGDGKADAQIQIGPVIRGTAIRDALDFISFNDFTNQIDFAQFGKAFNSYVNDNVLKTVPRDSLVGKTVSVLCVYPLPMSGQLPLVTPLRIEVK
ncbi:MAG: DUF2291 family protein [Pseudomonadota bacterium]|nr:DUF2291 family protein [Pseudomonadota bacterium]